MQLFVELFVSDLARSRQFYREVLGFEIIRDEPGYVALRSGEARVNLVPFDSLRHDHYLAVKGVRLGSRVEFCLEVADLEAAFQKAIAAGATIETPIKERPWGRTDFRLTDPDGAYWRITTPWIAKQVNLS
jgi:catechol 2,3-dioxygenase-like lactoylglutathione lyase family enzyme